MDSSSEDKDKIDIIDKITKLKNNLIILKKIYNKARNDAEEAIQNSITALEQDYCYQITIKKQIKLYKNAKKIVDETLAVEDHMLAIKNRDLERAKLEGLVVRYNKILNENTHENAEKLSILEMDAKEIILNNESELIGALMELNGDKSDKLLDEAKLLLE
jgi:hypothetical protein